MGKCLTRQLLHSEISGCLVEKPECGHAYRLGFSYLCRHPDHTRFNALAAGILSKNEMHELYDELRQKRRDEFLAALDENGRCYFRIPDGFFN
ncbi:MAG: hypothetical protein A2076_00305 [Geobacteraceae bacterium GWC2_53_11]|nr:MAG: hypothetical protein A2076_00305 [Geobacteraceae bacterium GWC2_53_11]